LALTFDLESYFRFFFQFKLLLLNGLTLMKLNWFMCYDNAGSGSELLTLTFHLERYFCIFLKFKLLGSECFNLATLFL